MKRWSFTNTTRGALWYILLVAVIPLVTLALLGLYFLWQQGHFLQLLLSWLALTAIGYGLFVAWPGNRASEAAAAALGKEIDAESADSLPEQLDPGADWAERDLAIWQQSCLQIETLLLASPQWQKMPEHALEQLSQVSAHYHGSHKNNTWKFTLPEALLVIAVASERYRKLVMDHVPFAERINLSSLVSIYDRQSELHSGYTWFNRARRTARLLNPMSALIGELRDQFTNRVLDQVGKALQTDLKRLLLQEIVQVGIDLYSGRLKVSDTELSQYRSHAASADLDRGAAAPEPLRIVLLGQVSAGKSSLINALINDLAAETDQLPSTDRTTVHALESEDGLSLMLVDTPGIDGDADKHDELVGIAGDADLILWTCRANQPARGPDVQLFDKIVTWFEQRPERRRPPMILALSHVDQLKPRQSWSPPYPSDSSDAKARSIFAALNSVRDTLGLEKNTAAIPICTAPNLKHYNIDTLNTQIKLIAEAATLSQLNRRRVESGSEQGSWKQRWSQVSKLGLAIGKRISRN